MSKAAGKSAPASRKQQATNLSSAKVTKLAPDTRMDTDLVTKPVPNAELADAQDDAMTDPAPPDANVADDDDDDDDDDDAASNLDEAADLEMMDAMHEAGDFDTDEDLDEADLDEDLDDDDAAAADSPASSDSEAGVPLPPTAPLPLIGTASSLPTDDSAALHPSRPTPYLIDLGHLLVTDPNPLPAATEAALAANTRDATQSLLNALLTTCPIRTLPAAAAPGSSTAGVTATLPPPLFALPREKPIPTPKAETPWERFAKKKGVGKYNANRVAGQEGAGRAGKMVYDEASGAWVPRWGYKGQNKAGEGAWLVEVDAKKEAARARAGQAPEDPRGQGRAERKERVRRNERKMRANERRAGRGGAAGAS